MPAPVTLSVEIELGWGHHDKPGEYQALSEDRRAETEALRRLLAVCDDHEIPITFGVVGHLLHHSCDGVHEGPHPDGWFAADPGTDVETDPHFYAPDLVEMIREAEVDHEVATHTYSHVLCDEIGTDVVDWELERVRSVHASNGLESPVSFVPPGHRTPPFRTLIDHDLVITRSPFSQDGPSVGTPFSTFLWILARRHPVGQTIDEDGIVKTFCTPYPSLTANHLPIGQRSPHSAFSVIPKRLRRRLQRRFLRRGVKRAIERDAAFHGWTHLYNMANSDQMAVVRDFLQTLSKRREANSIDVLTMADLAASARN